MRRFIEWSTATRDRTIALALLVLCVMIYVPFAGNYGMWDPWETHYGEVARQMLERNDFISQWWPGSPQDRQEFWSKPVFTFWVIAFGMKLGGIEWTDSPSQIADSWRVEWASRFPFLILGVLGIWATWELTRRLAGRRAGALAALILATASQWLFITRQVMTDMPFVVPMTVALAFAGLALLLPSEEVEAELPRRTRKLARWTISWPHTTSFYVFLAVFVLATLPQIIMIAIQLHVIMPLPSWLPGLGGARLHMPGIVPMLPYLIVFGFALWW